jgi:hypothetical protein
VKRNLFKPQIENAYKSRQQVSNGSICLLHLTPN